MAMVCGLREEQLLFLGKATGISALLNTGGTWLVSNATNPLIGGALSGISVIVSALALRILGNLGLNDEALDNYLLVFEFSLPILLGFAATALGYPVSIPLTLLIGAVNVASIFIAESCC